MGCDSCGFEGEIDLFCPECNEPCPDPEIEQEMQADAMLLDVLGGAFDDDPELKQKVTEDLREYYASK